jgi:hypothetical protein
MSLYLYVKLGPRWGWVVNASPGRFIPVKDPRHPWNRRLRSPPGQSRWLRKMSPATEPVASRCTNYAIPAFLKRNTFSKPDVFPSSDKTGQRWLRQNEPSSLIVNFSINYTFITFKTIYKWIYWGQGLKSSLILLHVNCQRVLGFLTLEKESLRFAETSITIHQSTRRNVIKDLNRYRHR